MRIPATIKILGHTVTVREAEDLDDCGKYDPDRNEIVLRAGLSQSQKEVTLLHEILGFANPTFHSEQHALLESIAQVYHQVLKDNDMLK